MIETRRCAIHHGELSRAEADQPVCFTCSNRILRHLRELEDYLPKLQLERSPAGGQPVSGPGFGSRSPANDSVIVHTDPRSDSSDRDGQMDGELGALGVVASWARVVVEERGVKPEPTAFLSIGLLRRNHDWIIGQAWVDEYADDLRQVHASVRVLAHDPIPRSQGKCIRWVRNVECRGDVFELDDASGVRCSRCRAIYTGLDLDRLRVAQEAP